MGRWAKAVERTLGWVEETGEVGRAARRPSAPGSMALTHPGPVRRPGRGRRDHSCGVALDAASRGLATALVEARDLASGTSSRSSKLIHGGLRYLEQLDFALVREALRERELILTRLAPHRSARFPSSTR